MRQAADIVMPGEGDSPKAGTQEPQARHRPEPVEGRLVAPVASWFDKLTTRVVVRPWIAADANSGMTAPADAVCSWLTA